MTVSNRGRRRSHEANKRRASRTRGKKLRYNAHKRKGAIRKIDQIGGVPERRLAFPQQSPLELKG